MPIHPRSPGSVPFFAAHLWWNSMLAYRQRLPSGVPALVVVGGEREDRYVDTARILRWARWQRPGVVYPFQCPRARHWITREPAEYGGPEAITLTREFAAALAAGTPLDEVVGGVICRAVN